MHDKDLTEYRVGLSATFDVDIVSTVWGRPGLDRPAIEELIERDWVWISADKNVLQESTWQLVSYAEVKNEAT